MKILPRYRDFGRCGIVAEGRYFRKALVKVRAAEEVAAPDADEFATAVAQAGGAGGAVDGVMFSGDGAGFEVSCAGSNFRGGLIEGMGFDSGLHRDRVPQEGIFLNDY
jgi:hypothetical protein